MRKTVVVLLSALALVLGVTVAAGAAAKPAYKVTLRTSVAKSTADHFIVVSGKVTGPKAAGHTVTIQRHYVGGPWITVATATIKHSGKYSARVETPRGGTTSFRALKGRSSARSAGASAVRSIPVYAWLSLAGENGLHDENVQPGILETVNGKTAPSIDFFDNDNIYYKTSGLCTKVTLVAAYTSPSAASITLYTVRTPLNGGPSSPIETVVNTGAPVAVSASLTGYKYLLLETSGYDANSQLTVSNPQIYCNADTLPFFTQEDLK